jgi:hypothetical protein
MIIAAELVHTLRPLAYTLSLRRWGRRSWRPWILSLALDVLSWQLTATGMCMWGGDWGGERERVLHIVWA